MLICYSFLNSSFLVPFIDASTFSSCDFTLIFSAHSSVLCVAIFSVVVKHFIDFFMQLFCLTYFKGLNMAVFDL